MITRQWKFSGARALMVSALLLATNAPATRFYWDPDGDATVALGGSGVWDTTSLWWRNGTTTGTLSLWTNASPNADYAQFTGTAGTLNLNGDSMDINVNRLIFDVAGMSINPPPSGTARLVISGPTPNFVMNASATILADIAGTGIGKTGPGTLTLGGNNTFGSGNLTFGATSQTNGYIRLISNKALGNYSSVTLASSGTAINGLEVAGGVNCAYNILSGGRGNQTTVGYALRSVSGDNAWSGNITASAGGGGYGILCDADTLTIAGTISTTVSTSTRTFELVGAGNFNITGVIANGPVPVAIVYNGSGNSQMTLSGANTYSGGTILQGGQINIKNGGTSSGNSAIGIGMLTINGGSIDNTGSEDLTLASNNPQTWNSGFTYLGSAHNLNLGNGAVTISGSATVTVANRALTIGGPISGYELRKAGAGTLVLAGVNTYSGPTALEAGELRVVVGGSSAFSPVQVSATPGNSALLSVAITDSTKQWNCSALSFNNGGLSSDLAFGFGAVAPSTTVAPLNVAGQLSFDTVPAVRVELSALNVTAGGRYPLITWTGTPVTVPSGLTVVAPGRSLITAHLEVSGSGPYSLDLVIDTKVSTEPLKWAGGNGTWDVANPTNRIWKDNTGASTYYMGGEAVVFDNVTGSGGDIELNTIVTPSSIVVNNTSPYAISGSGDIDGIATVTKNGAGRLTLSSANTYSGGTILNSGTLAVNTSPGALGSGALLLNGGTLDLNNASSLSFNRNTTLAGDATVVVERDAAGPGLQYTFGTLGMGTSTLTVNGGNVNGGVAALAFGSTTLSGDPTFSITRPAGGGDTTLMLGGLMDGGSIRNVAITGNGGLALGGVGSITGGTTLTVNPGTKLSLTSPAALGSAAAQVINDGVLSLSASQNLLSVTGKGAIDLGTNILTLNSFNEVELPGPISGVGGGLTMSGFGQLTLSATNTYSGPTTATAGTLVLNGPSESSLLQISGANTTVRLNEVRAAGTGSFRFNTGSSGSVLQLHFNGGGSISLTNALASNSSLNVTVDVDNNGSGTGGVIQLLGSSGLGNSTINVTGNNGYSLFLEQVVNTGGAAATMTFNPTTASLGLGSLTANQASGTVNFALDGSAVGNTVKGVISDKAGGAGVGITKLGSGDWTLLGTNTYTRHTRAQSGTLALAGSASISNSASITVWGNAIFDVSGLSKEFTLSPGQVLSNASSAAILSGSCLAESGVLALRLESASPALSITNGTLTLSTNTVVTVNNTGTALTPGSYLLVSKLMGGAVAGALPAVVVSGGGTAGTASLEIVGGELFLKVQNAPPTLSVAKTGNLLTFTWEGAGFLLQAQTNGLASGLSTNWSEYPNGGASPVQVTVDPANPAVFFRLMSQ